MRFEPSPSAAANPAATDAAPGARPRALVVGDLPGCSDPSLSGALDLRRVDPTEVLAALGEGAADLLLLSGRLPSATLTQALEALGQPGKAGRPAVIVLTEEGRRTHVEARLVDHADDFVNGSLGEEVLLARVRVALRMRAVLDELARKNAELEASYHKLEDAHGE
ncbi:MAG TPA: hypothetical protein VLI67_02655, partial [Vicinamibacteria bacterium]|nr:hypothetical protein [Vicinamibacteria bacterium]